MRSAHMVVAIAALLLMTAGPTAASPATELGDGYSSCMRQAAHTPDGLDHWADSCRREAAEAVQTEAMYATCISAAARTPDALEHWVDSCRDRATASLED